MAKIPLELLQAIELVTAKRARVVLDHILKHGFITTEELKANYGYNHPPRAARDVREEGIPLETFTVTGSDGRRTAAYRLGDPSKVEKHKLGGRQVFSKKLRESLYEKQHGSCGLCGQAYEIRYLQVDHRVPYEVAGDGAARASEESAFLLICGSCQRSKSWSCEHCMNWQKLKLDASCRTCYWASPETYSHLALEESRREVVVWPANEIKAYEAAAKAAKSRNMTLSEYLRFLARG